MSENRERNEPFDFDAIDTSGATHLSDRQLMEIIKTMPIIDRGVNGYGVLAEAMKRFRRYSDA